MQKNADGKVGGSYLSSLLIKQATQLDLIVSDQTSFQGKTLFNFLFNYKSSSPPRTQHSRNASSVSLDFSEDASILSCEMRLVNVRYVAYILFKLKVFLYFHCVTYGITL